VKQYRQPRRCARQKIRRDFTLEDVEACKRNDVSEEDVAAALDAAALEVGLTDSSLRVGEDAVAVDGQKRSALGCSRPSPGAANGNEQIVTTRSGLSEEEHAGRRSAPSK
jgi:hypothetical protein